MGGSSLSDGRRSPERTGEPGWVSRYLPGRPGGYFQCEQWERGEGLSLIAGRLGLQWHLGWRRSA